MKGLNLQSARSVNLTGFVLAGGASRRMGHSKETLVLEGRTMLERQVRLLRSVARRVVVVGRSESPDYLRGFNVSRISDVVSGRGPLAGVYTALVRTGTDYNLVLGCDLPLVNRRLLDYLTFRAISAGSAVTVPRSRDGRLQPLCAVYHRRARYAIRNSLIAGKSMIRSFFSKATCTVIPWSELARTGFKPSIFHNMNTPEEYERVKMRLEAWRPGFE